MLKSLAELGDCNEELEQVEKCMLPECRKSQVLEAHPSPGLVNPNQLRANTTRRGDS